eukprot:gene24549-biopygen1386
MCEDSAQVCEVYMKKNGGILACDAYCSNFAMVCTAQFDDTNNCGRGARYGDCSQTGGVTSDHICVCGAVTPSPSMLHGLLSGLLVRFLQVSLCQDLRKVLEGFISQPAVFHLFCLPWGLSYSCSASLASCAR